MGKLLENCKYVVLIAVAALMLAAIVTFGWGAYKTAGFVMTLVNGGNDTLAIVSLLDMMDTFLIGTVLFIFSIGLYELFIGKLAQPEWLVIDDLSKLKTKLSDVIVLFMAIKFLDKLLQSENYQDVLLYAISVAIVAAVLIAFNRFRVEKSGNSPGTNTCSEGASRASQAVSGGPSLPVRLFGGRPQSRPDSWHIEPDFIFSLYLQMRS